MVDFLLHPSEFRAIDNFVRTSLEGGRLDVIQLAVQEAGTADVDVELARRDTRMAELSSKPDESKQPVDEEESVPEAESVVSEPVDAQPAQHKGERKSKLAKRLEKEAKKEREAQGEKLRQRMAKRQTEEQERQEVASPPSSEEATSPGAKAVAAAPAPAAAAVSTNGKTFSCNTCKGEFPDAAAHRAHFRSEWHRINLKRKMKDVPILTEEEFNALSLEDVAALVSEL